MALRRRGRTELRPLAEKEIYARAYGERSDDVTNVRPLAREHVSLQPERRLTDRRLREAFRALLDRRGEHS